MARKNPPTSLLKSKSYTVGYRRPPRLFQFKPGQSGNPTGAKRKTSSLAPDLRELLERALNEKKSFRQGEQDRILSMAAAGIEQLVNQFAAGDHRARRDLMVLAEALEVDLTAGQREAIQTSVAVALTQNDRELVDNFIQHYLAEREHCDGPNSSTLPGPRMIQTEEST